MGGHVFRTQPIAKENIEATLQRFFIELKRYIPIDFEYQYLGSTGKKDYSGDIDLGCSLKTLELIAEQLSEKAIAYYTQQFIYRARTSTYEQCRRRAILHALADEIDLKSDSITVDVKNSHNGVIFFEFTQYDAVNKHWLPYNTQIDINFGNLNWLQFAYYSDTYTEPNIKGLHRTQLLFSLFHYKFYKFNHNRGILTKDNKLITDYPEYAVGRLNVEYNSLNLHIRDCFNFNRLYQVLTEQLDTVDLNNVLDIYLKILDSTRCDIPDILHDYWKTNKERLKLTGKFLPDNSLLNNFKN